MGNGNLDEPATTAPFDFRAHGEVATAKYKQERDFYADLTRTAQQLIKQCLKGRGIRVQSVDARTKDVESFKDKASAPSGVDPNVPKYRDPSLEITDLAGVRIISYFLKPIDDIEDMIGDEFDVFERSDKSEALIEEERFGYQSIHYLLTIKENRAVLTEYARFERALFELQVRTLVQHAWAEIEHDIQYKSAPAIPSEIRRRFMSLAGLLELADREFQAIQDTDVEINRRARENLELGDLDAVEISPDALRAYLDKKLGADARISDFSYDWMTRLLKNLGFTNLGQVDRCIGKYDDDDVSRACYAVRQGQGTRFELMLLAAMGERFIQRHTFANEDWYGDSPRRDLQKMRDNGIEIGDFDPLAETQGLGQSGHPQE